VLQTSKTRNDRLQGTIDLLVLCSLEAHGPMHGYGITLHIQHASRDVLRVEEGSLYPALHRMTKAGWLEASWQVTENNRRARYYRITAEGRQRLRVEKESWKRLTEAVGLVMEAGIRPQS